MHGGRGVYRMEFLVCEGRVPNCQRGRCDKGVEEIEGRQGVDTVGKRVLSGKRV